MKAIFLDRDGTINADTGYVHKIDDFAFENNAIIGLQELQRVGFSLFIITNQSGIGKGLYSEKDFKKFNDYLIKQLDFHNITIAKTYFCPFHPTDGIGKYRQDSPLRKPSTGMLEIASKEFDIEKEVSWIIGDKWSDVKTGNNFGIRSILLRSGEGGSDTKYLANADYIAADILDAARFIIN